jgi:hypothetical protein
VHRIEKHTVVIWACRKKAFGGNLFNNTISNSDYTASKEWMTANNELERMPGQTEKNHEKHQSG